MTGYRIFVLDPHGHVNGAHELEVQDDEAAVEVARRLENAHGLEIWQRARQVGHVRPLQEVKKS